LNIQKLTPEFESKYQSFLQNQPRPFPLFFYSNEYRKTLKATLECEDWYFLAINDEGEILGALPSFLFRNKRYGAVLNSLPFFGSHGGVLTLPGMDSIVISKSLINAALSLAEAEKVVSYTVISAPFYPNSNINEGVIDFSYTTDRIGQWTPLDGHIEAMENIHYKTRNAIRKGAKSGFTLTCEGTDDCWNFLVDTHTSNMSGLGAVARPRRFFEAVRAHIEEGSGYKLWVARLNNKPVAALLLFYFNETVEYFTPVVVEEYRSLQPLSFIIFEAMKDAEKNGYRWFNWGGTGKQQSSLYRFKSRWGAQDIGYRYYTKIFDPQLLETPAEVLLEEYPYFFVRPFNKIVS
jgi:hypothetical protein